MKQSNNQGMGFIGWLQILFIFLKLLNHIDWSWWWVLSPIIFCAVATIVLVILIVLIPEKK